MIEIRKEVYDMLDMTGIKCLKEMLEALIEDGLVKHELEQFWCKT